MLFGTLRSTISSKKEHVDLLMCAREVAVVVVVLKVVVEVVGPPARVCAREVVVVLLECDTGCV
jgi:hypothetical protein